MSLEEAAFSDEFSRLFDRLWHIEDVVYVHCGGLELCGVCISIYRALQ